MEFEEHEGSGEYQYRTEDLLSTKKEDRQKARKERRRIRHYKFSDKKHPKTAIVSCILAAISLGLFIWAVAAATIADGQAGREVGIAGLAMFIISFAGVILSLAALSKRDIKQSLAWTGIIANGIIWFTLFCLVLIKIDIT